MQREIDTRLPHITCTNRTNRRRLHYTKSMVQISQASAALLMLVHGMFAFAVSYATTRGGGGRTRPEK
jgi:hypothetical protein